MEATSLTSAPAPRTVLCRLNLWLGPSGMHILRQSIPQRCRAKHFEKLTHCVVAQLGAVTWFGVQPRRRENRDHPKSREFHSGNCKIKCETSPWPTGNTSLEWHRKFLPLVNTRNSNVSFIRFLVTPTSGNVRFISVSVPRPTCVSRL